MDASMTDLEYQRALREIENLMRAEVGTSEGETLDALVRMVEAYERANIPL